MQDAYQELIQHLNAYEADDFDEKEIQYTYLLFQLLKSVFEDPKAKKRLLEDKQSILKINSFSYLLLLWNNDNLFLAQLPLDFQKIMQEIKENLSAKRMSAFTKKEMAEMSRDLQYEPNDLSIDPSLKMNAPSAPSSTMTISSSSSFNSLSDSPLSSTSSTQTSHDSETSIDSIEILKNEQEDSDKKTTLDKMITFDRIAKGFQFRAGMANEEEKYFFENYFIKRAIANYEQALVCNNALSKEFSEQIVLLKKHQFQLESSFKQILFTPGLLSNPGSKRCALEENKRESKSAGNVV